MAQTKKRQTSKRKPTNTRKKTTNNKKKQGDSPLRYIVAIAIFVIVTLGAFQLGIVGTMIDSFFNYLFGTSRFLTYILILIGTVFITYYKALPKTRRTVGAFILQLALLLVTHIVFYFSHKAQAQREPVLSFVYKSYEHSNFPVFGGGLIGHYLLALFIPLISIVGIIIVTILLIASSIILLLKKKHRDVSKVLFEKLKVKGKDASENYRERRKQNKVKKEAKARVKAEKKAEQQAEQQASSAAQQSDNNVTDVSDLKEITNSTSEEQLSIPIYGHSESEDNHKQTSEKPIGKRTKRMFDQEGQLDQKASQQNSNLKQASLDQQLDDINSEQSEAINSISEAGEVENEAYSLPPLTLLKQPAKQKATSKAEVQKKGQLLETTLKNFGVDARVTQIKIGPAVTQYEIQPAQGVKVSKIVNLHNDIALALAAKDIRIEAPIPGRSAVGIEVPNDKISLVSLKEVLDEKFPAKNKLEVGLGRDISGEPITVELNKMPHMLVAGSTGSGKSVCINGIITSILLNAKPHEVKLMLIDPKMVELNIYNGIPHLLIPVVTNPHKASQALEKVVAEMERRYDLFQHSSTRNIEGYNEAIRRQNAELEEKQSELPYIVVIVDELADLMMVAGKEVENAIQRITQMARAAGIHLIIATQRPSVDVITGLIKNNIPSRIAFAVSSQIDSRTIIDSSGADKLLGKGDMLYVANGGSTRTRVQGAFLSDQEVQDVVNYVVEQQKANYVKEMEPDAPVDKSEMKSEDALYDEAYLFVLEQQKASTSLLQRQFRIGYNRASRLMDDLERNQVIGPQKGSKPRQILVDIDSDEV
ncbi:DNA translocase FtsK [Staphylococcus xylosus]|nr:DNA translocase FtsK [Staphylococcus xylosus]AID01212.1 cell division protein FtsK [Staphylococcus xylosus]ARD74308.1 cell division protein FtsK [Staphylococcus xylosus]KTW22642.1 cell division protein FtsK [Staphylococcus xylosus]MBO3073893.1 DNA translocase FtsK [Staphylococcus xylosus]MBV5139044.1 DNA translocase FtsK [Staphylococcus xylosus]